MPAAKISYPSPRVSQLDASILDDELFSLLKQQLSDAFQLISNKPWSYNSSPELWSLGLKLMIFKLTTFNTGSSYGFKLQNLKLSNKSSGGVIGSRTRYLLLGSILGEYMFKKFQSYIYSLETADSNPKNMLEKLKHLLQRHKESILKVSEDTLQVLEMLNFVSFLVFGRYPNLIHRILGISVTPIVADLLKFSGDKVNFEFQNRQLTWNVMTEFLVFILPLLQLRKLKRILRGFMPRKNDESSQYGYSEKPITTRFSSLPLSQCAMCIETTESRGIKAVSTEITNPFVTNCRHIFCYVCLATRMNAIENGNEQAEGCPRCRLKITSFKQYGDSSEDIDEDAIMVDYQEVESEEESEEEDIDDQTADSLHLRPSSSDYESGQEHNDWEESETKYDPQQSDYNENEDLEEEGEYSDESDIENEDFIED
ncbi:hypothetical protein JCM33374_g4009 [Metschnikowia sp. JCM 33374]|nr:hypothetical protein JCM33374_g4009 [Metschnikowia sp. JCM 33374]